MRQTIELCLVKVWERPAEFFCPDIASLVHRRVAFALRHVGRVVRDMGGHIAAMDTDSAMTVSTKMADLIPCAGGPHKLRQYRVPSGHDAIRELSFAEVDRIP